MKKILTLSVTTALLILVSVWGYANPYTVTVNSTGELKNKVNAAVGGAQNYNLITSLTVIGPLNGADLSFLQDLGSGPDEGGLGLLEHLDITEAHLPANTLPAFTFARVWIKEILLPNSVQMYEWQCFFNSKVEYVKVGTPTSILNENPQPTFNANDYTAFSNTPEMKACEVAEDNPYFTSIDGVIFTMDMKRLIEYPGNRADNAYNVPENVEIIDFNAFGNTRNLRTISFPNSLHTISDFAFSGSRDLSTINWGTGLEIIGYRAFMWATGMGEVDLPEGLKTIGYTAFFNAQMTKVTGPSTLTSVRGEAFRGDGFDGSSLVTLDFSKCINLLKIEEACFYDNFSLKHVLLPEGLKVIGDASFQNCYSIVNLVVPNSVETIEVNAFWMFSELYPHNMKTLVLGESVQTIQNNAFGECDKITEIWSRNPVPPALSNDAFEVLLNYRATLYVPVGSKQAYENATRWRDFANIVEDDFTGVEQFETNNTKVYAAMGHIVIEDAAPMEDVSVYSMSGALLTSTKSQGTVLRIPAK